MRVGVGVLFFGLVFGLGSEWVAYGWHASPVDWSADLVVGLVWIGGGAWAWGLERRTGFLFVAVGIAWYAGGYLPGALYWHRGVLVHLLVVYPGWRPASRLAALAVAIGYGAAVLYAPWQNDISGALLSLGLVAVLVRLRARAVGRQRQQRGVCLRAGLMLGFVLAGGATARSLVPMEAAVRPVLLAFETVLCGIAVLLAAGLRGPTYAPVTDLVVELGEDRWGPPTRRLTRLLGDPELKVGHWVDAAQGYVDEEGRAVVVPAPGTQRCATRIERDGLPFAVVVHDAALLAEPRLVASMTAAARLIAANTALQGEVRTRLEELTASRRRLIVAADEERARLENRLAQGAERRLRAIRDELARTAPDDSAEDEAHRARAAGHLDRCLDELRATARGLRPRELADGTGPALAALAGAATLDVRVRTRPERFPAEAETAVYYICAEAVTNAAKHSGAAAVSIDVRRNGAALTVTVEDDGAGGADLARGSGLVGVADRVTALGGELVLHSPPGAGTRLVVTIPLAAAE